MHLTRAALAVALVPLAAAVARADFASGGSVFTDAGGIVTSDVGGNISAIDGSYFLEFSNGTAFTQIVEYDANWASQYTHPRFEITVGSLTGTVTVDAITLDDGSFSNYVIHTLPAPFALAVGTNVIDVDLNDPGNIFGGSYVSYSLVTFQLSVAPGAAAQIDAIANPEPGTLALFGLGAAGLGAWAHRRRRKARRAAAAARA